MKIKHFVIFSIAMVVLYAVAEFISGIYGTTHDTLTTCFISAFGGELLFSCVLKIFEGKNDNSIRNDIDNQSMEDDV